MKYVYDPYLHGYNNNLKEYPHSVLLNYKSDYEAKLGYDLLDQDSKLNNWLNENFGLIMTGRWSVHNYGPSTFHIQFRFASKEDALAFILRWE